MSSITLSDGEGRDGGGRRRAISCAMASQQIVERISSPPFPPIAVSIHSVSVLCPLHGSLVVTGALPV